MLDIKFPATILTKGALVPTWKGTTEQTPDTKDEREVVVHLGDDVLALLSGMFGGTPPEHLSAAALASKYTAVELMTAATLAMSQKQWYIKKNLRSEDGQYFRGYQIELEGRTLSNNVHMGEWNQPYACKAYSCQFESDCALQLRSSVEERYSLKVDVLSSNLNEAVMRCGYSWGVEGDCCGDDIHVCACEIECENDVEVEHECHCGNVTVEYPESDRVI